MSAATPYQREIKLADTLYRQEVAHLGLYGAAFYGDDVTPVHADLLHLLWLRCRELAREYVKG